MHSCSAMDRHMQHSVIHTIAFLAFSCPASSCLAFSASPIKAKFHYTDAGPTRTWTFLLRNSVGSVRVRSGPCPCRTRVRVRIVEFSYYSTPGGEAGYRDERACLCVCLSVRSRVSGTTMLLPVAMVRSSSAGNTINTINWRFSVVLPVL